jgi:O-antigen/teichoic acid export membrane protein
LSLSTLADRYCPSVCRPILNRVQQSPIGKRIVSGTFWLVVGNGFGKLFTFIAMVLVARILGKEEFGEFGLVRSTAMTFVAFSSFGMGITATKYIAELLHTDKERTGRIIGLTYVFTFFTSFVVAIIFYLISPWICEIQLNKPELLNVMQLGSVLLFLMTFMGTQVAVMTGFQDFRGLAVTTIISSIIILPIYIIGTYYWGLYGGICGVIIATFLNILINSGLIYRNTLKHNICYNFLSAYKELFILWNGNIPITLNSITYTITIWICLLWLGCLPNGSSELGAYFAASSIYIAIAFIPQNIFTVTFPTLSKINSNSDTRYFYRTVSKITLLIILATLIIIIPVMLFATPIMLVFGDEFIDSKNLLLFACISLFCNNISSMVNQVFYSQARNWECFFYSLIYLGIYCCLVIFLLRNGLGSSSIFLSRIIADIIYVTCMFFVLTKTIKKLKVI